MSTCSTRCIRLVSREVGQTWCIYGMRSVVEAVQNKIRERGARELSKPRDKSIYLDVESVLVRASQSYDQGTGRCGTKSQPGQTENTYPNEGGKRARHVSACNFPATRPMLDDTDELARKRVEMTRKWRVASRRAKLRSGTDNGENRRRDGSSQTGRRWRMVSLQVQVKAEVSSSSMASRSRKEQKRSRELDVSRGRPKKQ
jgi:hypothetical protein